MREWLSGRASPCQGERREFESRLPLQNPHTFVCGFFLFPEKIYYAICCGCPEKKEGFINIPIKRKEFSGILRVTACDGKDALTEYYVEKQKDDLSLIKLIPHTGRTHQLRVHMSHIGHPIYGDGLYGNEVSESSATLLHCRQLSFIHPTTGSEIELTAPFPDDMIF